MRSAAYSHAKMAKVSRYKCMGSRSFQTKSKPACLHRHGAREKSGILTINNPFFLTPPQEQVELNKLMEKKVGVTGNFENFFLKKKPFSPIAIHTKTRMQFGSTLWRWSAKKFEPCLPETVWTWFQQKVGTFMFKNRNDGATLAGPPLIWVFGHFWLFCIMV